MRNRKIQLATWCLILLLTIPIQPQTGGDFEITQSVIASGGGQDAAGGDFSLDATIGQAVAGSSTGSPFSISSGFWNFTPLAPTAAVVTIGGRVKTLKGNGILNARVILTAPNGVTITAVTGAGGVYRFENVLVGETYIVTVAAKRFVFAQPAQVRHILEETTDIDFVGDWAIF